MLSADEYRDQAWQCYAQARRQLDPHGGYILRGVADAWLRLAQQVEDARGYERFSKAA